MVNVKKKTVDNWKKKKWYNINADAVFDSKEIAKTVALESKQLMGRTVVKSLNELTSNIRDSGHTITFKINKVTGTTADTQIQEFNTKVANLKRMVRRGKSKVDNIFFIETKDGNRLKLKTMFLSGTKFPTANRREVRKIIEEILIEETKDKTIKETWSNIIFQKFSDKIKKRLVKLGYVHKVLVVKAKLT
jgi:small subunit ribosomal protein S3Ae